ncbi:restriction endonuclease [Nocardia cyriacigeorgica]|uniref:restriction endonuclease n=1 Tax=Nocardia cyriacigeorgica TaxID=135487 RepID=UPI0024581D58|nr:restriction endonuclease [Nocardia cyriacigeorgica]
MANLHAAIRKCLAVADNPGSSAYLRGRAWEEAVAHMFRAVPGCEVELNAIDRHRSSEVDLLVSNERLRNGLTLLPTFFPIECKYYSTPITSMVVRDFRAKIQDRNCELGVLVAAKGVTGNASTRHAAYQAATSALNQGIEILLLTRDDLASVRTGSDVVHLLHASRRQLKCTTTFPDPARACGGLRLPGSGEAQLSPDAPLEDTPTQLELFSTNLAPPGHLPGP